MRAILIWLCVVGALSVGGVGIFFLSESAHPAPAHTVSAPAVTPSVPSDAPLSARVVLFSPLPSSSVSRSFDVSGQAPGQWFFEAQFPIQVRDGRGNVIGRTTGHTDGDWMSEGVIPFAAHVELGVSYHGKATLVLLKDNLSGLPERDDSVSIPIVIN